MKLFFCYLFFVLFSVQLAAQDLELIGKPRQGGLIFAYAPEAIAVSLGNRDLKLDREGRFVFGFDRNDTAAVYLRIKYADGYVKLMKLKPEKSPYKIQRINNLKAKYVEAPPEERPRIERERTRMKEARKTVGLSDEAYYAGGFAAPVKKPRITGVFGSQRILNGVPKNVHNGLDFGGWMSKPVYAMSDGYVVIAGDNFYYNGNFVLLDHGQGLNSFYLHMSKLLVKDGEFVKKGQLIGKMGSTGRSTGPHLHWGVQWYGKRVDPQQLLKLKGGLFKNNMNASSD